MLEELNYQVAKELLNNLINNKKELEKYHPSDIAKVLKDIFYENGKEEFFKYIEKIPEELLGEILLELPQDLKDESLKELSINKIIKSINELDSDDAADLIQDLEELDREKSKKVLNSLDEEELKNIKKLSIYDENQAGSIMQTELFDAKLDEKISDSIERLKKLKEEKGLDNIHTVFLVDEFGYLVGAIDLEDLITFDFNKTFRDYLKEDYKRVIYVKVNDNIDEVIKKFEDYNLTVLAVVDIDGKLVGRITSDDIYDIIEERATEQIYKMAGVDEESEDDKDIKSITKSRAIWLGVNLITAIAASLVIGLFEATIQAYVALAVLMPIVASMGGNAGTQTLTVMVRQLALEELSWSEAKKSIYREISIALLNGFIFGLIMGAIAYFWFKDVNLGYVIALAMIINLFFAGLFGAIVPLILKRLGVDPAVASSVLLTTVTDVVGFFAFLGLAKMILL